VPEFSFTSINNTPSLAELVITSLETSELQVTARELEQEYTHAEGIGTEQLDLDDIDIVVALSGRAGFTGLYEETKIQPRLCPNNFDPTDTLRRVAYATDIAKRATNNNKLKSLHKPILVYFNGVKRQNDELQKILEQDGGFHGYPAQYFIIDSIPLDNTLGQVIGLSKYLHEHWPLLRAPTLVLCSSSYHVPRVARGFGDSSPLHTPQFWANNLGLLKRLPEVIQTYVLNPGNALKHANLIFLGCDRKITANIAWEKDLFNDMQARVNYSEIQDPPSIGLEKPGNDRTLQKILMHPRRALGMFKALDTRPADDSEQKLDIVPYAK
jgi:hypothetical protein